MGRYQSHHHSIKAWITIVHDFWCSKEKGGPEGLRLDLKAVHWKKYEKRKENQRIQYHDTNINTRSDYEWHGMQYH